MPAAIVTGSSRGLGRATALQFAADGYDVAVNYHTSEGQAEDVANAVRDRGQQAVVVGADVADPDAAARFVSALHRRYIRDNHYQSSPAPVACSPSPVPLVPSSVSNTSSRSARGPFRSTSGNRSRRYCPV